MTMPDYALGECEQNAAKAPRRLVGIEFFYHPLTTTKILGA